MRTRALSLLSAVAVAATVLTLAAPASAHTDADLVAVAAGDEATLTLKPTHGCDGSPTVEVAIKAPVTGATAGEVEGWTATATGEAGATVLEWTGGPLPADAEGAFPVQFTVPDAVGELLTFPAVQVCEDGEELAWIDGDPEGEYPAPRILVLPAGSAPAATIDDVPADAPGRDQLSAIVDVDNPTAEPADQTTTEPDGGSTTTTSADDDVPVDDDAQDGTDTPPVGDTETEAEPAEEEDDVAAALVIALVLVAVVGGVAAFAFTRRKRNA